MFRKILVKAALVSAAVGLTAPALADPLSGGEETKIPNCIVIKEPTGDNGQQVQGENAQLIPVNVEVQRDSQGNVDREHLKKECEHQVNNGGAQKPVEVKPSQTLIDQVPDEVRQEFEGGEHGGSKVNYWNWYWYGWYGYNPHHSYYGYYNGYYPYYGYYYNRARYPYYYGHYRHYPRHRYSFYFRW